jgi:hypothetical protein
MASLFQAQKCAEDSFARVVRQFFVGKLRDRAKLDAHIVLAHKLMNYSEIKNIDAADLKIDWSAAQVVFSEGVGLRIDLENEEVVKEMAKIIQNAQKEKKDERPKADKEAEEAAAAREAEEAEEEEQAEGEAQEKEKEKKTPAVQKTTIDVVVSPKK